jgi:hypothetical protein
MLTFDGASDIDTGVGRRYLRNVSGGTIMGWLRPTSLVTGTQSVWGCFNAVGTTRAKMSVNTAGQIELRGRALDADATSSFLSTGTIVNNDWAHVAGVFQFSSKSGIVYINGVEAGSGVFSNMTAGNTSDTDCKQSRIGSNETGTTNAWIGDMEDVRVYARTVGPAEVLNIYTARGRVGSDWHGVQARWPMIDKGAGTLVTLADVSKSGFSGTAGGTITFGPAFLVSRNRPFRTRPPRR